MVMKRAGDRQSQADHTLFIKYLTIGEGELIVLLVYVDDISIIGNDEKEGRNEVEVD